MTALQDCARRGTLTPGEIKRLGAEKTMAGAEDIFYHSHWLQVQPTNSGWCVYIFQPAAHYAEDTIPESADREACIAEAKRIVDRLLKA